MAGKTRSPASSRATMLWVVVALGAAAGTYYAVNSADGKQTILSLVEAGRNAAPERSVAVRNASNGSGLNAEITMLRQELDLATIASRDLERRVRMLESAFGPETASIGTDDAPEETAALSDEMPGGDRPVRRIAIADSDAEPIVIPVPGGSASAAEDLGIAGSGTPEVTAVSTTEFAVELSPAMSLTDGRAIWNNLVTRYPNHLGGLDPRISIVERDSGQMELRLVAGPIRNAATVTEICAGLKANGQSCRTTVFDGQRIAMN